MKMSIPRAVAYGNMGHDIFKCVFPLFFPSADQFAMSLREFYEKVTRLPAPKHLLHSHNSLGEGEEEGHQDARSLSQFTRPGFDPGDTVKDSIHLDCKPVDVDCHECGVNVVLWDGFAHRTIWNRTWEDAVAFQPVSTRLVA